MIRVIMLNVGNADAIIIRIINGINKFTILVDGGKDETHSGIIINRLNELKYKPQLVIATHLDEDHIGGLGAVLKEYKDDIKALWMHRYEQRSPSLKSELKIDAETFSKDKERDLMIASLNDLDRLVEIANNLGIPILEPFSDTDNPEILTVCAEWGIKILGPSEQFLDSLLPRIRRNIGGEKASLTASHNPCDNIGRDGSDSPANESSVIFQILHNDKIFLFTGDAGLKAFGEIRDSWSKIFFLKVPHHGSRKNLSKEIIEKLKPQKSFISALNEDDHPHPDVAACLKKHGSDIKCTGKEGAEIEYYQ